MNGQIFQEPDTGAFSFVCVRQRLPKKCFDLSLLPVESPFSALNKAT